MASFFVLVGILMTLVPFILQKIMNAVITRPFTPINECISQNFKPDFALAECAYTIFAIWVYIIVASLVGFVVGVFWLIAHRVYIGKIK